jgi:hypothetical protein
MSCDCLCVTYCQTNAGSVHILVRSLYPVVPIAVIFIVLRPTQHCFYYIKLWKLVSVSVDHHQVNSL